MKHAGVVYVIQGELNAALLAVNLISASKWYELTPLCDDLWSFVVKDEPGVKLPNGVESTRPCWIENGVLSHRVKD
jgi:hypothetical protein